MWVFHFIYVTAWESNAIAIYSHRNPVVCRVYIRTKMLCLLYNGVDMIWIRNGFECIRRSVFMSFMDLIYIYQKLVVSMWPKKTAPHFGVLFSRTAGRYRLFQQQFIISFRFHFPSNVLIGLLANDGTRNPKDEKRKWRERDTEPRKKWIRKKKFPTKIRHVRLDIFLVKCALLVFRSIQAFERIHIY